MSPRNLPAGTYTWLFGAGSLLTAAASCGVGLHGDQRFEVKHARLWAELTG